MTRLPFSGHPVLGLVWVACSALVCLVPNAALAQTVAADFQNLLFIPAPSAAIGHFQPLALTFFSGNVAPAGRPATPTDGSLALVQSAFGQPFASSLPPLSVEPECDPPGPFRLVLPAPSGGGFIVPNPFRETYDCREIVTVTAVPASGWQFLQWLGDAAGTDPVTSVVLDGPKCVQASFGTMGFSVGVAGAGTVSRVPESTVYPHGTVVRLVAVPLVGQYFAGWNGAIGGTNNPLNFTIADDNPVITASFAPLPPGQFALTVALAGSGRVTSRPRGNKFLSGAVVTTSAVADPGQLFLDWSGDTNGASVVNGTNLVVTMNQSRVITARFTQRPRLAVGICLGQVPAGGFQLLVSGQMGEHYQLETATNLIVGGTFWAPLARVTNSWGVVQFNDVPPTGQSQRFYRATLAP